MGAWGVGMQASDAALDGIAVAKVRKSEDVGDDYNNPDYDRPKARLDARAAFKRLFAARYLDHDAAALGVAEWLLDRGVDLTPVRAQVLEAVARELRRDRLDCWVDRAARKRALELMARRVRGDKLTAKEQAAVDHDNRGLLTRIAERLAPEED